MTFISRRAAVRKLAGTALGVAAGSWVLGASRRLQAAEEEVAPFELPALDYAYDALEPAIDARTMEIHHSKHHAAYVKNLNAAITQEPSLAGHSLDRLMQEINSLPESIRTLVRDNGGGHWNHDLFWKLLKPGGSQPGGALFRAIQKKFGGMDELWEQLQAAGLGRFGSGWAWLSLDPGPGTLLVESTPNQDNPLMQNRFPLIGIDVWEHAYYLHYQNRRSDYLKAIRGLINWEFASDRFASATG